jgi:putative glycosyltransferase (TIGR04348 family)
MRIGIVTPAPPGSRYGNRITALRWARILRRLGNRVSILQTYSGQPYDLLVALHARRSHPSIISFQRQNPAAPVIVALTGTDLYRDMRTNHLARESLDLATRIVVLQPKAVEELQRGLREKTRVIYQSFEGRQALRGPRRRSSKTTVSKREARSNRSFDVCVIGHLRVVKDPFRTAMAARLLPSSSRIRVLQVGGAMTDAMAAKAMHEMRVNRRYEWLGERRRTYVYRILANSQVCVISSRMEGGANVLSEAITASVPILATRIDGNIGILGRDYPGYFNVGDTKELAQLMLRVETSSEFLAELRDRVKSLEALFTPAREQKAWSDLKKELFD